MSDFINFISPLKMKGPIEIKNVFFETWPNNDTPAILSPGF